VQGVDVALCRVLVESRVDQQSDEVAVADVVDPPDAAALERGERLAIVSFARRFSADDAGSRVC
jgi:hypothetical protein